MGLPGLSIRRPIAALMIMLILIVVGLVSLSQSPLELMPKMNVPVVVIMTVHPGASPQEVATMVTEPVEAAVAATSGLTTISSTSQESLSLVLLQFDWNTNLAEVRTDVQEAIDRLSLPEGVQKPALIKFDPNMLPVMTLSASADADLTDLKADVESKIVPRLEKLDGVASVFVTGAPDREIQVLLNQEKMLEYGLTQSQITGIIQGSNLTYPAGSFDADGQTMNLRIVGKMGSLDDLKSLIVTMVPDLSALPPEALAPGAGMPSAGLPGAGADLPGAGLPGADLPGLGADMTGGIPPIPLKPIRLSDVAEIRDSFTDNPVINRTNGKPSLNITIQKEAEANTTTVANTVAREVEAIAADHPEIELVTTMNQGDLVNMAVGNVTSNLVVGGALAVIVLLIFLRSLRPTVIIAVAIPFSVIVTFVLMYFRGLTLNMMTLGGLALGVGMLVDNAIVVIENIFRHLNELGEEPAVAAERGANEVAGAITASTLTTVAVFLPVVFVGGLTGELFRELALTVSFSLICSLAVSLSVIPMLASRFLRRRSPRGQTAQQSADAATPRRRDRSRPGLYVRMLRWSLRNRAVTLLVAVAVLAGSVALVPRLGSEFLPSVDEGSFTVQISLPHGTPLEVTAAKVAELAEVIEANAPVKLISTTAGTPGGLAGASGLTGGSGPNSGRIRVELADDAPPTAEVMQAVREAMEPVRGDAALALSLDSAMMNMGGISSNTLQLSVAGPDAATLREVVADVEAALATIDGVSDIQNNLDTSRPELQVVVDQDAALEAGLAPAQVALAVADAVQGRIVTRLDDGVRSTDVRVLFRAEDRDSIDKLEDLQLHTALGEMIALHEVATVTEAFGPVSITREQQRLSAQVDAFVHGRDLGTVVADVNAAIDSLGLPDEYTVRVSGAAEMMQEGFENLSLALIAAVLLIYMIMAAQFESLLHPFTIMFSVPLAAVGAIVGLFVSGHALGITAMIGVVILAGIVVNNAIVLVDFVNQLRARGMPIREAIVEAGRTRLRPILMTSVSTIIGLVPLALGLGEGTELQAPMAVVIMGGLLTSTALTLLVVPVMYDLLTGGGREARAGTDAPAAAPDGHAASTPGTGVPQV